MPIQASTVWSYARTAKILARPLVKVAHFESDGTPEKCDLTNEKALRCDFVFLAKVPDKNLQKNFQCVRPLF